MLAVKIADLKKTFKSIGFKGENSSSKGNVIFEDDSVDTAKILRILKER